MTQRRPILIAFLIIGVTALILGTVLILLSDLGGISPILSFGDRIGVIPVEGSISDTRSITSSLVKFRKDKRIKGIILRINSPGGAVAPTQEVYREVRKTLGSKTVVAYLETVAASGGYYIAAAANKIVANPGTLTGSIGVLMEFVRLEDLFQKIGISLEVLKSGEYKDVGSPFRKLTDRERELIHSLIEDIQAQFVRDVAEGRNLPMGAVREIADGRVVTGMMAKELGLVDTLGNFEDALELTKKEAGIEGEAGLVYPEEPRLRFLDFLMESLTRSLVRALWQQRAAIEYRWNGLPGPN